MADDKSMVKKSYWIKPTAIFLIISILCTGCFKADGPRSDKQRENRLVTAEKRNQKTEEKTAGLKASDSSEAKKESGDEKASETKRNSETEKASEAESGALSVPDIMEMEAGTILSADILEEINMEDLFLLEPISRQVFERMDGISFGEDCTTKLQDLRYLRVLHTGFDKETHIGELVCNKAIAEDLIDIFKELYENEYPIEKMLLVDYYGGDDELSMEDNNTSCFNFRPVSGTGHLSQHAYGRAIDINPLYNPYITSDGYTPVNAGAYVDRSADNPYKIDEDDLCCQLFEAKGFTWGGNWNSVKDYQHFQRK